MSYTPVRCKNGCGDLPVRMLRSIRRALFCRKDMKDEIVISVMCRKCKKPTLLSAGELELTLVDIPATPQG